MLRSIGEIAGYVIEATDGHIGHVRDFYFDDTKWVLRYFVVETGVWLRSRKVLISPIDIGLPDDRSNALTVSITQDQVRHSPDVDTDMPVSRQHEKRFQRYYGYAQYWSGSGLWGDGNDPTLLMPMIDPVTMLRLERDAERDASRAGGERSGNDPHLRSFATVVTYRLHATDGEIGHVCGLLVDDSTWAIRYLIVETRAWWTGNRVLMSPTWAESIDWSEGTVSVGLTRDQVRRSPVYDPDCPLDREQERALHGHYDRRVYWADDPDFKPAVGGH